MSRMCSLRTALLGCVVVVLGAGPLFVTGCKDRLSTRADMLVDKTILQFDDVAVGYPRTQILTISTSGNAGLSFSTLAVRGGGDSPFSILGVLDAQDQIVEAPAFLPVGGSMELVVQYDPASEDAQDSDILELMTNDPDDCPSDLNQCEIQLNGTGAPPDAELNAICQEEDTCPGSGSDTCWLVPDTATNSHPVRAAINYCDVVAGSNRQIDLVIRNEGNIPLTLDGIELTDTSSEDFSLLAPDETSVELAPGADLMLSLLYAPQLRGVDVGRLEIQTNDLDLTHTDGSPAGLFIVALLGNSAEPDIDVSPLNIPFTGVTQGGSDTQTIMVSNTGDAALRVEGIEVTGGSVPGEFSVDREDGFDIPIGGSDQIEDTYAPPDVGADDGSVIIHSNDPDESEVVVTLGGEVRPDLDVTPESVVEYIEVPAGGTETQDVTLRNVGYADLTVAALAFDSNPGDPPVFALQGLPGDFPGNPIVLAPAESLTFQVQFTDNELIADEVGQLNIGHDSPSDVEPYPLLLLSTGTPANLPPVAVVDPPTQVIHGLQSVSISAANSFDPDAGDSVAAYNWSFLFKPQDAQGNQSQAVLDSTDQVTTSFTPDMTGQYVIRLVVYDTFNAMSLPVDAEISVNQ